MSTNVKSVAIQISAAKGPWECCWVVTQVSELLLREAKKVGIKATILEENPVYKIGHFYLLHHHLIVMD